jgi:hypothetical protein
MFSGVPQVPVPGIGAIAHGLGGIPVAGAMMAGGLMAAAGTYSSRLSYEQAMIDSAPFLMRSKGAMGFTGSRRERPTILGGLGQAADALGAIQWGGTGAPLPVETRNANNGLLAKGYEGMKGFGNALLTGVTEMANVLVPGAGYAADMARGGAMVAGKKLEDTVGYSGGLSGIQGRAGTVTRRSDPTFDSGALMSAGISFGLKPQDAIMQAAAMSRAAGAPMSAQDFTAGMAMQRTAGVGVEDQGALMKQLRYTGNSGSTQEVANMIGVAVAGNLEGSEIGDFLREQTGWLQGIYARGDDVSMAGINQSTADLQASGVTDMFRASGYARSFAGHASQVGRNGPSSGSDLRLMRAMGYTGAGGIGEFSRISMAMQNPGEAAKGMKGYLDSFKMDGMDEHTQALVIQRAMGSMGTNVSAKDAYALSKGMQSGTLAEADLEKIIKSGRELSGQMGGNLIAEGSIEADRIKEGAKVAESMQHLSRTVNNIAGLYNNTLGPAVTDLAENLYLTSDLVKRITEAGQNLAMIGQFGLP